MKYILMILLVFSAVSVSPGQADSIIIPESETLDIQFLIAEAMMNNPEIQAALYQMDVMDAKVPQSGAFDDPELLYMRDEMPGFRFNEAMYSRIELMQKFRFPSKLSSESNLATIRAEHAHHDHLEIINKVVAKLKSAYYELWLIQQNTVLENENLRLMKQFLQIAGTKYTVGQASQQEVLKAQIEIAMIGNELLALKQKEQAAKLMMMALLNRESKDTLGFASVSEEVIFSPSLDSLEQIAFTTRPMLIHDSLSIMEGKTMRSLATREYLPDFTIGIQHVTSPMTGFDGWGVRAGITLPFAPWTLGKASARVEEADAEINRATSAYQSSRNMVRSSIREKYSKAVSIKQQLENYRLMILPQARQSLSAGMSAYQTGTSNFLMLIDSYRTLVNMTKDYFMARMQFEQTVTELELEVGYQNIATLQ